MNALFIFGNSLIMLQNREQLILALFFSRTKAIVSHIDHNTSFETDAVKKCRRREEQKTVYVNDQIHGNNHGYYEHLNTLRKKSTFLPH